MSRLRYIAEYAEFSLLIVSAGVSAKLAHVKLMLLSILSTSCLLWVLVSRSAMRLISINMSLTWANLAEHTEYFLFIVSAGISIS